MAERRSFGAAVKDLEAKLAEAQLWQQQCQRDFDLAEERIIAANASVAALTDALQAVYPERDRKKKPAEQSK